MTFNKDKDRSMSVEEALELVKTQGFLYSSLPRHLQQDKMIKEACNDWYEDHIIEVLLYYKEHPEELKEVINKAKERGYL
jgi:hypothetical protein